MTLIKEEYEMVDLIYKDEAFQIVGICMDVHSLLGGGFLEIVYKDAIVDEFIKRTINYLAVSKCKLGLIVNFGKEKLTYKRIVL